MSTSASASTSDRRGFSQGGGGDLRALLREPLAVIRTRGDPFASRPSRALVLTSLVVVATGLALPFTPLGRALGFVTPPLLFFPVLIATVAAYLSAVEVVKRWFYRRVGVT